MITIFTPSFADEENTNAQNLTVKEIVARLDPHRFRVIMMHDATPDPRIVVRANTVLLRWHRHGNTVRGLCQILMAAPDIYFFPREGPLDAGFLRLKKWLKLRTALVTYIVSGGLEDEVRPTLLRNMLAAQAVVGNCLHVSSLIQRQVGLAAQTIYDGIDRRYYYSDPQRNWDNQDQYLTVLYAGSFRPKKRVDVVIRLAARWPGVKFRIAGQGEEEPRCRTLAADLQCKNVTFLGHLPPKKLGDEMRSADVFLFPSILEGHPQVLGQAAACGLPAIAMNLYRPEYVVDGTTGFLVDSDLELEQRLSLLLTDAQVRRAMAGAAVGHARNFDWDDITRQWEHAFDAAVAKGGKIEHAGFESAS